MHLEDIGYGKLIAAEYPPAAGLLKILIIQSKEGAYLLLQAIIATFTH